jgi:hypothetical protein
VELLWGVKVHSLTPSHILGSMLCDSQLPSWPATLQTLALVASPRLGLWQQGCYLICKPKGWPLYVTGVSNVFIYINL